MQWCRTCVKVWQADLPYCTIPSAAVRGAGKMRMLSPSLSLPLPLCLLCLLCLSVCFRASSRADRAAGRPTKLHRIFFDR